MNRAARKRATRLRDDALSQHDRLEGEDLQSVSNRLDLAQYAATLEHLMGGAEATELASRLAREVLVQTEYISRDWAPRFISGGAASKIDCREGCAWCCHKPMQVSVLDAIAVANFLKSRGMAEEYLPILREHCREKLEPLGNQRRLLKTSYEPCPFLSKERTCSVYESRPVVCRAFHSLDSSACESKVQQQNADREVPLYSALFGFVGLAQEGARRAVRELGLDERPVLLAIAVKMLLEDFESVVSRWLAGENVFEPAAVLSDG